MRPSRIPLFLLLATLACGCCKLPDRGKETSDPSPVSNPRDKPVTLGNAPPAPAPADTSGVPDIPEGRSNPPTVAEWASAQQVNTQERNSQAPNCFIKVVREWAKLHCEGKVIRVDEKQGFGTQNVEHFESVVPGKFADYVVRLRRGVVIQAKIYREEGNAAIFVNWPAGAAKPVHIAMGRGS